MWDIKCIIAAICFLTSNTLFIVHGVLLMKEADHNSHMANANDSSVNQNIYGNSNNYDSNKANSAVKPTSYSFQNWKMLDPTYIESRWVEREAARPIMMCAALFGAMAWFWLMVPIVQSAWILSKGGKRSVGPHMLLAALAIVGSLIELISRLMIVGMTNASEWMAKDFNLDDWDTEGDGTGWRVLEMIHIITRGMLLWVDAFEALALFGIVVVIFYSVVTEPKFRTKRGLSETSKLVEPEQEDGAGAAPGGVGESSTETDSSSPPPPQSAFEPVSTKEAIKPTFTKCFAGYGLFVGILALADFLADVLRFLNWRVFGRMAMATNVLVGVIFLPIWLLCLGRELPLATERYEREEKRTGMLMRTCDDAVTALKGNEREIS